jgi:hypothetical protein
MNLWQEGLAWIDSEAYAIAMKERFNEAMGADPELRAHRDFCGNGYGMGEDCFHWMWKLLVDEMPWKFKFLEVGVYKGQILSLIYLLAYRKWKFAEICGVTLLSPFAGISGRFGPHPDDDYRQCIQDLHDQFGQLMPHLIVGDSTSTEVHDQVQALAPFDIIFVDACHEYEYVSQDLLFYPELIREGGFLVLDDAACDLKQPWGWFQGIADVCDAARTIIETNNRWQHLITVAHDRVWRRRCIF